MENFNQFYLPVLILIMSKLMHIENESLSKWFKVSRLLLNFDNLQIQIVFKLIWLLVMLTN